LPVSELNARTDLTGHSCANCNMDFASARESKKRKVR
jgi:hypothetical protein